MPDVLYFYTTIFIMERI